MARKKQMNESKALITQALIRLLNEKPLTSISMTEIANEAGVVRMTQIISKNLLKAVVFYDKFIVT